MKTALASLCQDFKTTLLFLISILFVNSFSAQTTIGASPYTVPSSGNYKLPAGVTSIDVYMWGAGGGSGGAGDGVSYGAGGGGGGGAFVKLSFTGLASEQAFSVSIGARGAAGGNNGDGGDGGNTTFTLGSTYTANGGKKGLKGSGTGGAGGAGGAATAISGVIVQSQKGGNGGTGSGCSATSLTCGGGGGGAGGSNTAGANGWYWNTSSYPTVVAGVACATRHVPQGGNGGGASPYAGGNGASPVNVTGSGDPGNAGRNGVAATVRGGGAAGGNVNNATSRPGAQGAPGEIIIVYSVACTAPTSVTLNTLTSPVCSGTNPGTYTATVSGGSPATYTYQWFNNTVNTGVATATYSPGAISAATNIYCVVSTGSGCTTTSLTSTINVTTVAAPTATSPQSFCNSGTVANLTTTSGTNIQWYSVSSSGSALAAGTALTSTNYYASQTSGGCESGRTTVAVTINTPPAITTQPVATSICSGASGTFSVATSASSPTYLWEYSADGSTWNSTAGVPGLSGQTSNTLTLNNPDPGWSGLLIRCVVKPGSCQTVSNAVVLTVNTTLTPPTSISGPATSCHGASVTLTSNGGSAGNDVWYEGSCSEAYVNNWNSNAFATYNTTVNSISGGILTVTSTSNDPMIDMTGLGSFDPAVHRYINIRYRVVSGTAGASEIFFYNTAAPSAIGAHHTFGNLISDNQWHILSVDMHQNSLYTTPTGGNITGWRYDWATNASVVMELDFIALSGAKVIGQGASITVTPTKTTTYSTKKIGNCNTTTCIAHTVTLPTTLSTLSTTESATCAVSGNNWIHFYAPSGRFIASIHPNNNNLGNVTMSSATGSPQVMFACNAQTNPLYNTAYMERSWIMTSDAYPFNASNPATGANFPSAVTVRLPFADAELVNLNATANTATPDNPNDGGTTLPATLSNLMLTKYSGAVEDNSANNCTGGGVTRAVTSSAVGINPMNIAAASYLDFSVQQFSEFFLHKSLANSPLPVTLTHFSANCNDHHEVKLNWSTASEQNASHFTVEKSRNLTSWSLVDVVSATGNSNHLIDYEAIDVNSQGGTSYYRLVQTDVNGAQEIFGPISVACHDLDNNISIFPNPSNGHFTVEISSMENKSDVQLQLVDLSGKIVSSRLVNLAEGVNQILFESELNAGIYIVRVGSHENEFKPVKLTVN